MRELRHNVLEQLPRARDVSAGHVHLSGRDQARRPRPGIGSGGQSRRVLKQLTARIRRAPAGGSPSSDFDPRRDLEVRRLGSTGQVIRTLLFVLQDLGQPPV